LAAGVCLTLAACAGHSLKADNTQKSSAATAATAADGQPTSADPRTVMVDRAMSMLGQPYRWGGAAPGGFDCSGLVAYAASGAGIRVPRTAHEQLAGGIPIARGDLQTGDLVFMRLAHKELHVGIAIDKERFIHAPSAGGRVRIDSLAAQPYAAGFLNARRLIFAP
jgi:cell wall-associated NlpC family hydrolase